MARLILILSLVGCVAPTEPLVAGTPPVTAPTSPSTGLPPSSPAPTAPTEHPGEVWVLVHPSGVPALGPGIYRVDLTQQRIVSLFGLPFATSPQALFDDGDVLWVGSIADDSIYTFDRDTGNVIDEWSNWHTKGITGFDGRLFIARTGDVVEVDQDLEVLQEFVVPGAIEDIATDGHCLYVLQDGNVRILDLDTGLLTLLGGTANLSSNAMVAWDDELLIGREVPNGNTLLHVGIEPRQTPRWTRVPIDGFVTAISLVDD